MLHNVFLIFLSCVLTKGRGRLLLMKFPISISLDIQSHIFQHLCLQICCTSGNYICGGQIYQQTMVSTSQASACSSHDSKVNNCHSIVCSNNSNNEIGHVLTPWSRVRKLSEFYGTRTFITAFTRACHLSLSWARLIQSKPCTPLFKDPFQYYPSIYTWVF
jgi:hypothetical protein